MKNQDFQVDGAYTDWENPRVRPNRPARCVAANLFGIYAVKQVRRFALMVHPPTVDRRGNLLRYDYCPYSFTVLV